MSDPTQMYHIQRDIIDRLSVESPLRFSKLQPKNIPNNVFTYHLKQLKNSGYLLSSDKGYELTRKALKSILHIQDRRNILNPAPRLITMIYATNEENRVLLVKRSTKPFVSYYGLPSGTMHAGETIHQAAYREFKEKTKLEVTNLKFCGLLDFQYIENNSLDRFIHAVAMIFSCKINVNLNNDNLHLKWSDLEEPKLLPEVKAVQQLIQNQSPNLSIKFSEPN